MNHPQQIHGHPVLGTLGNGAASALYVVSDPETRELLALKHVRATEASERRFLEQAEREHQVGSKVTSPLVRRSRRLIRYRELLRTTEIALLLDFVDGQPLDESGRLPLWENVAIFGQAAAALAHLHGLGWVHGDLKPGNLIRTGEGTATLIDLGQASMVGDSKSRIQGTPGFIAPEQLRRARLDPRTDAFLLGATIYRQLTGRYAAAGLDGTVSRPRLDRLVASAPEPLVDLVERCLSPDPVDRPSRLDAVAEDLAACATTLQAAARRRKSRETVVGVA